MTQNVTVSPVEPSLSRRSRRMTFVLMSLHRLTRHRKMKQNQGRNLPIVTDCARFCSAAEAMTCQKGGLAARLKTWTGTVATWTWKLRSARLSRVETMKAKRHLTCTNVKCERSVRN